jgi:hypothetical protein
MRSSRRDFLCIAASTSVSAVALTSIRQAQARGQSSGTGAAQAILASQAHQASGKSAAPVGLLVNGASNPLAIDRDALRFT